MRRDPLPRPEPAARPAPRPPHAHYRPHRATPPHGARARERVLSEERPHHAGAGHGRRGILLAAAQAGLGIAEYPPATVKKTVTGAGGAAKAQVGRVVARLLRLTEAPRPADAADGVAVALTHILRT